MNQYNFSFILLCLISGGFVSLLSLRLVTLINVAKPKEKNALLTLSTLMLGSSIWLIQVMHGLAFPLVEKSGFSLTLALISWIFSTSMALIILLCASQTLLARPSLISGGIFAGLCGIAVFYFDLIAMQIQPAVTFSSAFMLVAVIVAIFTTTLSISCLYLFKFKAHLYPFRKKILMAIGVSFAIMGVQCLLDQTIQLTQNANSMIPVNYDSLLIGFKIALGFICLFIMPFIIAIFYDKFKFNTFLWRHLTHPKHPRFNQADLGNNTKNPDMHTQIDANLLKQDLLEIFSYDALNLQYQIKVDSKTRMPVGAEAFLRWSHPEKGLLSPADFMPLAEALDMRDDIDAWVIEESCRMLHRLKSLKITLPISVNLSQQQLNQPALIQTILELLKRFDLPRHHIVFEIPESIAFNDKTALNTQLAQFKAEHIQIAIDDFGTQSSTLAHLQNLPVSELKLGPALTADIEHNVKTRSVIQAVIDLAHALNLNVVAESVETEGQRKCLMDLGCDQMQGFIISPPLPEHRLIALLKNLLIK